MTNSINSNRDFNELLFENKNKSYGAYALRTAHGDTMAKSMFITFSAVCVLVFSAYMLNKNNGPSKSVIIPFVDSTYTVTIEIPHPDVPLDPSLKPSVPEEVPYSDNLNLKADDKPVDDQPKAVVAMIFNPLGDIKGKIDSSKTEPVEPKEPISPPIENNKIEIIVTEMPELKNLNQFIADNLRYPAQAVDAGVVGTVYLSFVVEKDGSVSNAKVLRGIGGGCEEEALRVVKMLPKWKPGKNNGELVRVQFNLPVKFKLQ